MSESQGDRDGSARKRQKHTHDDISRRSPKRLVHDDYTVGWICALEVELSAALEMLDKEHDRLFQPLSDHNAYTLGSIAERNVVIAGLWTAGNNAAATVVTQMRNTFPNIQFALLVGIGGGVPVVTDLGRIRLGDVIVSRPTGIDSGAVQYDHGKAINGCFQRTGALAPPPAVLLQAAQDLAAKRIRSRRDPIIENIQRIDWRIPGLSQFKYPGAARDCLYPPEYTHQHPKLSCHESGCDPARRIMGDINGFDVTGDNDQHRIVIHRGTIASGELVLKDAQKRDQLAAEHGVLCFEMEAAGALADFPCLVIRGVSDYCDSHKNDVWHGYAAAAAAAYARQLFFHMPVLQTKRMIDVQPVEQDLDRLVERSDENERHAILDFISMLDYESYQIDTLSRSQEGTGQWFLESSEFATWKKEQQILFCPGIPGGGKTVLTSIVVDHLQQQFCDDPSVGVAYIFCDFRQGSTQTINILIASVLKQLVQKLHPLPQMIRDLYARDKNTGTLRDLKSLDECLNHTIGRLSKVYIIVDALDECEEETRYHLLSRMFYLHSKYRVNLLATSRATPNIASRFDRHSSLEIHARDEDVGSYLLGKIHQLPRFVQNDTNLRKMVVESITEAIHGMFLLAKLYIDSLKKKPSIKALKSALQNLPTGSDAYHETYHDAMERIHSQHPDARKVAMQVLSWLSCVKGFLTLTEIQHALATELGSSEFDKENLPDLEALISCCAGLVAFDEHSHVIRLVHYTTQQYFIETWNTWFPSAHKDIAEICLTYLAFDEFEKKAFETDDDLSDRLHDYPLYDYSSRNWAHHARLQEVDETLLFRFINNEMKVSSSFQVLMASSPDFPSVEYMPKKNTGLHLAAYCGFVSLVHRLLEEYEPDTKDDWGQIPLAMAAARGHHEVVALLIAHGSNADSVDPGYITPLEMAAKNGHVEVCRALLQNGFGRNYHKYGKSCVGLAAQGGHTAIVELLLDAGLDQTFAGSRNHQLRIRNTALPLAAEGGHSTTVDLLFNRLPEVDSSRDITQTALLVAAQRGHKEIVENLIARGVDPNAKPMWGITSLLIAIRHGQLEIAKVLLERGANPNIGIACTELDQSPPGGLLGIEQSPMEMDRVAQDIQKFVDSSMDMTPFSLAAERGYRSLLEHLISLGAVPSTTQRSPIIWACQYGYRSVVDQILEQGADSDARDLGQQGRPMLEAATNGHHDVVRGLLQYGADAEFPDGNGQTPLSKAAEYGRESVVQLLLEANVTVGSRDNTGQTPFSHAVENGHLSVLRLLAEKDKSGFAHRDMFGRTPLLLAAEAGRHVVDALLPNADGESQSLHEIISRGLEDVTEAISSLDHGALLAYGGKCLLWAVQRGHRSVASLLLGSVDPNFRDSMGLTPLSMAIRNEDEAMVSSLLDAGADRNALDNTGRSVLSWALLGENERIINLLLNGVELSSIEDQHSALSLAVQSANDATVKPFLEPTIGDDATHWRLQEAIHHGHKGVAKHLIDSGFDPDYRLTETSLHLMFFAAWGGLDDVVRFMLEKGADCDARLTFHFPVLGKHQNLRCGLILIPTNETILSVAARRGHVEVVRLLLDHGADPELTCDEGKDAFESAFMDGDLPVVMALVEHALAGGYLQAEDLLVKAAKSGVIQAVHRILEQQVDVDWRSYPEGSPLAWAAYHGHEAVVKLLLAAHADPNRTPSAGELEGWAPLHLASYQRNVGIAKALLEAGADPNITVDGLCRPALSMAAENGCYQTTILLLKHQAAVDMADECNRTPLFYAVMNGHETIVKILLNHDSVAAEMLTSGGRSALSLANDMGRRRIALLLQGKGHIVDSTPSGPLVESTITCDTCNSTIYDSDCHFHCPVCSEGDDEIFSYCVECFSSKLSCDDTLHSLEKRSFSNGEVVVLETIRPW